MELEGWWARLALVGLVASAAACRDDASAPADTDTDTDGSTATDTLPETDTSTATDSETESDGDDVVTTELTVNVTFANQKTLTITNSLHVWVVQPKSNAMQTCSDLVADVVDPYDLQLIRLADQVSTAPADPVVIPAVEVGDGFVYVEGVTVGGAAELAGCGEVSLVEPKTSVEIALGLAGTFDCSDPETESGAPCDDGMFCTVGESCSAGACTGGGVRDCSVLADLCNAASCSEADGCVLEPVPNDTTCSDDLACTDNDSCQDGVCVGLVRDCDAEAPVCQQAVGCAEPGGDCIFVSTDEALDCDDGLFCTENTTCQSGACLGDEIVCPGDDCNLPSCDEDNDECTTTMVADTTVCDDGLFCTENTTCQAGECVGTAIVCPGDDCNVASCDEVDDECTTAFADDSTSCDDTGNECTEDSGLCDGAGACVAAATNEGGSCDNGGLPGSCTGGVCG